MRKTLKSTANNPILLTSTSKITLELRNCVRSQLPEAMIPAQFIVLDNLPKLPNGKVDRSQLPMPIKKKLKNSAILPTTPDEVKIAQIWQDLLGTNQISINDSFFDLGGDSLTISQMVAKVRDEYNITLSLRSVLENPTIATLAKMISQKGRANVVEVGSPRSLSSKELLSEVFLPSDISFDENIAASASVPYQNILLTGGTGYTGAFLLHELLEKSKANIYVLVRAGNRAEAFNRLRQNMARYGLWNDIYEQRLKGVVGDIARPYFSVSREIYEKLARQIEMIIHNAAISSYALPYKQLKPVNVLGTIEVVRLASYKRIKPLHFISSLAVYSAYRGVQHFEEIELTNPDSVVGGYRQSKWVADCLIALAKKRGLPACTYRPGQISGSQYTGGCSTDTFLNAAIKGCIQLGFALDFDVPVEIVPVDFFASAVVNIALSGKRHGQCFNLPGTRPMRWNDIMNLTRDYGYSLKQISYKTWYRKLAIAVEQDPHNALTKFFPLFGADSPSADVGIDGSFPYFRTNNLSSALTNSHIRCKTLDHELMSLYLDYFTSVGYLPSPSSKTAFSKLLSNNSKT
jgi:thioester reductase-like protein